MRVPVPAENEGKADGHETMIWQIARLGKAVVGVISTRSSLPIFIAVAPKFGAEIGDGLSLAPNSRTAIASPGIEVVAALFNAAGPRRRVRENGGGWIGTIFISPSVIRALTGVSSIPSSVKSLGF